MPFCVLGLFVWFFADALFRSGMFVFRDAGHYYYPLFKLVCEEWGAGRVPLWNPYENMGQPLAGDPTASVFYPGKLIFALPLGFDWAYRIYVTAHVLLAAWAAFRLARYWRASTAAAGACAISYAFCGNVLFQYCNVVFLVGAAWLPLAVLAADRMLTERSSRQAVIFGVVLAMMTLGGDPRMAYNAGVMAAAYALLLWWRGRSPADKSLIKRVLGCHVPRLRGHAQNPGETDPHAHASVGHGTQASLFTMRPALLAIAAVAGLTLSAVQVLPSMEFASLSERTDNDGLTDRFLCRDMQAGTHEGNVYAFSVGPWRMAEYVWPNISGRQFPVHRRWLEVLPAEGRIWTPSLYMGILPLLLAIGALRFRRAEPRKLWMSWAAVLGVAAGFGWYGFGWLMREMHVDAGVGEPFGGVYWLMTVLLPGYAYFRYPAKLLVVAALGLSVLAAWGWDDAFSGKSRIGRWLSWLGGLSVLGLVGSLAIRPRLGNWLAGVKPDALFGPLDTVGAANDIFLAFTQTAILCGLFYWLLRMALVAGEKRSRLVQAAVLLLVAVDLAVANGWMVVCAPASSWHEESELGEAIATRHGERVGPARVYRYPIWQRPSWRQSGSADRMSESMQWDHATLWPKYNLADRISILDVQGSMTPRKKGSGVFSVASLAEYVILPGDKMLPDGERVPLDTPDVSLWIRNPRPNLMFLAADVQALGHRSALPQPPCSPPRLPCVLLHHDPLRVELEVELAEPGTVVLSEQFYPGWRLRVQSDGHKPREVPIVRTDEALRGTELPAGRHNLVYSYQPASFVCGAAISGIAWLMALLMLAIWIRGNRS